MNRLPHFVLFSRSEEQSDRPMAGQHEKDHQGGSWYFRIQSDDGRVQLEASDREANISRERLELLAVVRGLEAFDQPSSVTLVTTNPQISRSVRQGLDYWRDRNWMWERFGEKVPMTNSDLWQRIDRAIQIHEIRCRTYRMDMPHATVSKPKRQPVQRMKRANARGPQHRFQPIVAATKIAADGLNGMADSLRRWLPEPHSNPHPTL